MANTTNEEQKKIDEAQKKSVEEQSAAQLPKEAPQQEIVYLDAPTPATVSNQLPKGAGYYVRGKLVDPDGDLMR